MVAGGLLLSCTLIFFAVWLQLTEQKGWPGENYDVDRQKDKVYLTRRRRSRRIVNLLIGTCGVLILIATLSGVGRVFVAAWLCVTLFLFAVVLLALLDAIRTFRYEKEKLRDLRRQSLGDED